MANLQTMFMLSDKGYKDLKQAIVACTLTNFSLLIPFGVAIQLIIELLKPLVGGEISWYRMWLLFGVGVVGAAVIFWCSKNDYKKTYVASYMEAEAARISLAEHIRKLPMRLFNTKDLAELTTNLMGDVAVSEHCLSHIVPQLISNFISITVITVLLALLDWRMALAMFVSVPLAFAVIILSRKIYGRLHQQHVAAKLAVAEQVQEYLEGIKVIHACNLSGEKCTLLTKALRSMTKNAITMELGTGIFVTGAQAILQSGIGITVLLGAYLLSTGQIELVPLLTFMLIVARIYGPFLTELTLLPELFYHQHAVNRLRLLLAVEPMSGHQETTLEHGDIVFKDVTFSYQPGGEPVIAAMNIVVPAGSITALVGPSGSGKSTVSRLIARFWDVDAGQVTLGGIDVRQLEPEHLMKYMSFVFQDVVLFNDTVYNNIRIGNIAASYDEVMAAAAAAQCDEFIDKLPQGYQTILGENGATLSGGERQRLSIARALLKSAPIVLLDEATAALDPESEALIQQAIGRLIKGKTVVVIAHRLRTIVDADKIIVLEQGRVAEQGTHRELLAHGGLYQKLYQLQQASMDWAVGS